MAISFIETTISIKINYSCSINCLDKMNYSRTTPSNAFVLRLFYFIEIQNFFLTLTLSQQMTFFFNRKDITNLARTNSTSRGFARCNFVFIYLGLREEAFTKSVKWKGGLDEPVPGEYDAELGDAWLHSVADRTLENRHVRIIIFGQMATIYQWSELRMITWNAWLVPP